MRMQTKIGHHIILFWWKNLDAANFDEQLALARNSHAQLIARLQNLPPEDLWLDRGIRSHGWVVTIGRLLEVEAKDEAEHLRQIRDFMGA